MTVRVRVLGPVSVWVGERELAVPGARVRRLLVRLAVEAPRPVSRSELVDAVWCDGDPPTDVGNALQSLVSRLRRSLGSAARVESGPAGYWLVDAETDVAEFERIAAEGHHRLRAGEPDQAVALLRRAADLWDGEALVDAGPADYAGALVAGLSERRLDAIGDRIDADLQRDATDGLGAELEELCAALPLRERFAAQLMEVLRREGRSAEALAAYARLAERLADELGTDPSPAVQELHVAILRGSSGTESRRQPPPPRTPLTSFVGRADEVARIHALLAEGRLVTIVGPGGAGKTRLAAEAVRGWRPPAGPWEGSWLVELAAITGAAEIAPAMLSSLGIREARMTERPGDAAFSRDARTRLMEALHGSSCLLVVDNCEHVIESVAELIAELLATCPGIRVLATSREPLGIDGESLCAVRPLSLPPADADVSTAMDSHSVRLFADRAAAVSAGFAVDAGTVGAVVEIVRRLDGLPLAIELAAARLRVLPVDEIAARLGDRFRLLTGGSRTALPRHRTLRAVVAWSWDLLQPAERLLAERLAVFPAGATPAGAADVCAGGAIAVDDVPGLLDALVDKSLLQVVDGAELRYRMLETIREYGVERLADRGEIDAARMAHARHYAGLVEQATLELRGPGQRAALARLEQELGNVLAALRFLGDTGDVEAALGVAIDLMWFWMMRNEHADAALWLRFAVDLPGARELPLGRLAEAGTLVNEIADIDGREPDLDALAADRLATTAQALARQDGLGGRFAPVRALMLVALTMMADDAEAMDDALQQTLASGDPWLTAIAHSFRAAIAENNGAILTMRSDAEEALAAFRELGDSWGASTALASVAYVRMLEGDIAGARTAYEEAAELAGSVGSGADSSLMTLRATALLIREGRLEQARADVERVLDSLPGRSGIVAALALALLGTISWLTGDAAGMREVRAELESLIGGSDDASLVGGGHGRAISLAVVALLFAEDAEVEEAVRRLERAYPIALATHDQPVIATVGMSVAHVAQQLGQSAEAAEMLGASAALRGGEDPTDPHVVRLVEQLVRDLGRRQYAVRFAHGRGLSTDAAHACIDPARLVLARLDPGG